MNIDNYDIIIWDWNGTLFDDAEFCMSIMNKLLASRNLRQIDIETYRNVFTFPLRNYYRAVGHDVSNGNFRILGEEFMVYYEKDKLNCRLHEYAIETLRYFKEERKIQFMLSAYSHHTLQEILAYYGIAEFFERIVGNDNIFAEGKFNLARKLASGISNISKALIIGDTIHDLEIAENLGIESALIANGHQSIEKLKLRCNDVFPDLKSFYFNMKSN